MSWWPWGKKERVMPGARRIKFKVETDPRKHACRLYVHFNDIVPVKTRKHKDGKINKRLKYAVIESFDNEIFSLGWTIIKATQHSDLLVVAWLGHMGLDLPISHSPHIKVMRSRE